MTNKALDLVQSVDIAPNDAANADALTGVIQPFSAMPTTDLPQSFDKVSNKTANADALIQPYSALPATDLRHIMGETPNEATNADALTGVIQPFPTIPAMNPPQTMGKDPIDREISASFETHFNEICPINLLGSKCKCDLVKVNLTVSPSSIVERINTADCE